MKLKIKRIFLYYFYKILNWIRFGKITEKVKASNGYGTAWEIEYQGRGNKVIGYWAYGNYDPDLPYAGKYTYLKKNKK